MNHINFAKYQDSNIIFSYSVLILLVFSAYCCLNNSLSVHASHCIEYDSASNTIALTCGSANLYDISDGLGPNKALSEESKGVWVLNSNLVIGNSATLNINSTYTKWLKINSSVATAVPYHINILGNFNVVSSKISSWDFDSHNYPKGDGSKPRPYITILPQATGNLFINDSEISFLGYSSPLAEGLSFYGGNSIVQDNSIHNQYYGVFNYTKNVHLKDNKFANNIHNVYSTSQLKSQPDSLNSTDKVRPYVSISYPVINSSFPFRNITVEGTAFDEQSRIQKVEVFVHTFPFNNQFPYKLATQSKNGSWNEWKYPININASGLHRISARVTDAAGNQNWAESLFTSTFDNSSNPAGLLSNYAKKRLAVVNPLFTDGAYNVDGFYEFYPKYDNVSEDTGVTTNLNLLTSQIPDYDIESKKAATRLINHLEQLTGGNIYSISDEDVHEGYIFNKDGSNAYDVLFFLHDEYATKYSYSHLKQFVRNGGTIVFMDGNALYAEIKYNPDLHTVVLLRGHGWRFDGNSAEKNVHERWLNENKDWVGSSFLWSHIEAGVTFRNNPFNYSHFEENYVSNPQDHILYDYGAVIPSATLSDNGADRALKIATYSLQYGKGKIVMLGLYTQRLLNNTKFLDFFDNMVFPQAAGNTLFVKNLKFPVYYFMTSGNISDFEVSEHGIIKFGVKGLEQAKDSLVMTVPKELLTLATEGASNLTSKSLDVDLSINGKAVKPKFFVGENDVGITVPLTPEVKTIEIRAKS